MTKTYELKKTGGDRPQTLTLSPSKLDVLKNCPRCFWLQNVKNIKRPSGAFPSLPRGIDATVKAHWDRYRNGLPPELEGKVPGVLFANMVTLERWRNYRSGVFAYTDEKLGVVVAGALDDCLVNPETGCFAPLDAKTKNAKPKTDGAEFYQVQLDCYSLFFKALGLKTDGKAYLAYYFPMDVHVDETPAALLSNVVHYRFGCEVFTLEANADRAVELIERAVRIIRDPKPPAAAEKCEFCGYGEQLKLNTLAGVP